MTYIRSYEPILSGDMKKLSQFATDDLNDLVSRKKHLKHLKQNRLCICLCQGAAWQHVHGDVGIKDFDVWTFFKHVPGKKDYPPRRFKYYDFGPSKFGTTEYLVGELTGRKVDILARSIVVQPNQSYQEAVLDYLQFANTKTSQLLAEKSVVVIWPPRDRGNVIWEASPPIAEPVKKKRRAELEEL